MDEIRVGLIGYGASGRVFHAPIVAAVPGLRLASVLERHGSASRERYPSVEVVREPESLFTAVDLVVVATPNASHFDLARAALLAGKHVVVDKPMTATSADAARLVDLARERRLVLTAFQNRRWDGDFLTVAEILAGGRLGRLVAVESAFDRFRTHLRPGAWREQQGPGSGLLFDIGSHLVDQALVLFGLPSAVTADVRRERDSAEADDAFDVALHYDGLRVSLNAAMVRRVPRPRFALHGTLGSFVKHGLDPQEEALRSGATPAAAGWGTEPEERWGVLDVETGGRHAREAVATRPGSYQTFYENVRDAVAGRAELAVGPEQACGVIRLLELARRAAAERRTLSTAELAPS